MKAIYKFALNFGDTNIRAGVGFAGIHHILAYARNDKIRVGAYFFSLLESAFIRIE